MTGVPSVTRRGELLLICVESKKHKSMGHGCFSRFYVYHETGFKSIALSTFNVELTEAGLKFLEEHFHQQSCEKDSSLDALLPEPQ